MRIRGPLMWGVLLLGSGVALGQTEDRSTALPPLLPPPVPTVPVPAAPTSPPPVIVYDPAYQYIPERAPEQVHGRTAEPFGRWWTATSLELAWTSTTPAPQMLRLRPPDAAGRTIPALRIPLGDNMIDPFRVGLGLTVGRWFGDESLHGIEGSFFVLPESTRTFDSFAPRTVVVFPDGSSRSAPVLIRLPNAFAGVGTTFTTTVSSWFAGADVNYRVGLLIGNSARLDLLAGYRFAYLQDSVYLGDRPEPDHDQTRWNRLSTDNTFHGGQLGLSGDYRTDTWYAEGSVKIAYGAVTTNTTATGAFLYSHPVPQLGSNTQDAVLPTLNVRLGYRVGARGKAFVGYSFQYLSHVNRLGDAFCSGVMEDDFWVQSLNLGFEWRF